VPGSAIQTLPLDEDEAHVRRKRRIVLAVVFGALVEVAVLVLLVHLESLGLDWKKWFKAVVWTLFVFGLLLYLYGNSLKRLRCLLPFLAMLALHAAALAFYLRSAEGFPTVFFLFLSPFEAAGVAAVLVLLGADMRRDEGPPKWRQRGGGGSA